MKATMESAGQGDNYVVASVGFRKVFYHGHCQKLNLIVMTTLKATRLTATEQQDAIKEAIKDARGKADIKEKNELPTRIYDKAMKVIMSACK